MPGISKMLGASPNVQADATRAGVIPSRSAWLITYLWPNTGLCAAKPEPRGKKGTKAIPRLVHS